MTPEFGLKTKCTPWRVKVAACLPGGWPGLQTVAPLTQCPGLSTPARAPALPLCTGRTGSKAGPEGTVSGLGHPWGVPGGVGVLSGAECFHGFFATGAWRGQRMGGYCHGKDSFSAGSPQEEGPAMPLSEAAGSPRRRREGKRGQDPALCSQPGEAADRASRLRMG